MRTRRLLFAACVIATAASTALATSAVAAEVTHTAAELRSVKTALDGDPTARIAGTAWSIDSARNQVVVIYDDTVTGGKLTALKAATKRFGGAVWLEHMTGTLELADSRTVGGNAIFGGSWRCSLGFNAIKNGVYYFLTAGHCTHKATYWYDNDHTTYLGYRIASFFDGIDYGVVQYTNTTIAKYGMVDNYDGTYQDITTSRRAVLNEFVCRAGSTTGKRCGYVQNICSTVNMKDPDLGTRTLYCMIQTSACGDHGDSGGPLWSGGAALGIFSGGRVGCGANPNGPTYFSPVHQILQDRGMSVF